MAFSPRDEFEAVENAVDLLIHHLSESLVLAAFLRLPHVARHAEIALLETRSQWSQDARRGPASLVVPLELSARGVFRRRIVRDRTEQASFLV